VLRCGVRAVLIGSRIVCVSTPPNQELSSPDGRSGTLMFPSEYLIVSRRVVAPATAQHDQSSPGSAAPAVQPRRCIPVSATPARNDASPSSHDELVIFSSML
jgi:hypothetical protein